MSKCATDDATELSADEKPLCAAIFRAFAAAFLYTYCATEWCSFTTTFPTAQQSALTRSYIATDGAPQRAAIRAAQHPSFGAAH